MEAEKGDVLLNVGVLRAYITIWRLCRLLPKAWKAPDDYTLSCYCLRRDELFLNHLKVLGLSYISCTLFSYPVLKDQGTSNLCWGSLNKEMITVLGLFVWNIKPLVLGILKYNRELYCEVCRKVFHERVHTYMCSRVCLCVMHYCLHSCTYLLIHWALFLPLSVLQLLGSDSGEYWLSMYYRIRWRPQKDSWWYFHCISWDPVFWKKNKWLVNVCCSFEKNIIQFGYCERRGRTQYALLNIFREEASLRNKSACHSLVVSKTFWCLRKRRLSNLESWDLRPKWYSKN